jgi:hypothetical protein
VTRQAATALAVRFQIGGGALAGASVGQVSAENPTLVGPADHASTVWGPIVARSLAYTTYQALPGQRQNPPPRRVGWFVAGAFAGDGLRQILFPETGIHGDVRQADLESALGLGQAAGRSG